MCEADARDLTFGSLLACELRPLLRSCLPEAKRKMLSILRKARLKDKDMRILML